MRRLAALAFVAMVCFAAIARAEPGQSTPAAKPSVQLETAMPDDDNTVVRPAPPSASSPSPSPSASAAPTR